MSELQLWGGIECTVNRVGDDYFSQLERNGHATRPEDIERIATLGVRALRYPVLWERTAPRGCEHADWHWADERLPRLRRAGVEPIVGFVHHGSGPRQTSLVDDAFAPGLAAYAQAFAQRYPWVTHYTPVNEPLTTARFSALYGVWYPHARDDRSFVRALLNQTRATVLSMQAVRRVNPAARLVQTDDLGKTYGTPQLASVVEFYNQRRWLGWDLLCGKVDERHPLWVYLLSHGADPRELRWLQEHRCPPDVLGVNYYVTGERWLDHRLHAYPERHHGGAYGHRYADIECPRARCAPTIGIGPLLQEAWERYRLPIAVTEAHIDAHREDQLRWLHEIWRAAQALRAGGADVRAVTVWALLGSFDWNCLVTRCNGYYEPGPFDVRAPQPRPTALAALMRELAAGQAPSHPVVQAQGWWRRPDRYHCSLPAPAPAVAALDSRRAERADAAAAPLLLVGRGRLADALHERCGQRHIAVRRAADAVDTAGALQQLQALRPWTVVYAGELTAADALPWAIACAARGIAYTGFSSCDVYGAGAGTPRREGDMPQPLTAAQRALAEAEQLVLHTQRQALVVRCGPLFGGPASDDPLQLALQSLAAGQAVAADARLEVSPTYLPDLLDRLLDLLIDGEAGLLHLATPGCTTWAALLHQAAGAAGVDAGGIADGHATRRHAIPGCRALVSERCWPMPPLADALARWQQERTAVPDGGGRAEGVAA